MIERLSGMEAHLRKAGLRSLRIFGSRARGASRPDSDLDLLFEVEPDRAFSLIDQARLQAEMSDAIGVPVDLVERDALRPAIRARAEQDAVTIF